MTTDEAISEIETLISRLETEQQRLTTALDSAFESGARFGVDGTIVTVGPDREHRHEEAQRAMEREESLRHAVVALHSALRALRHEGPWPEDE